MKEGQEERVFSLCTGSSWFIHGGVDYTDNKCMYIKEASDYKKLYSLRSARRRISRPENTYVDNLMKTGEEEQELKKFK